MYRLHFAGLIEQAARDCGLLDVSYPGSVLEAFTHNMDSYLYRKKNFEDLRKHRRNKHREENLYQVHFKSSWFDSSSVDKKRAFARRKSGMLNVLVCLCFLGLFRINCRNSCMFARPYI